MQKHSQALAPVYEPHRNLVRQIHERVERTYAYGGLGVLAALVACVALVSVWTTLGSALPWVAGVSCALIGLFVVRGRVKRARARAREDFEAYCQLNGLAREQVHRYFVEDANYPFFSDLYESTSEPQTPPTLPAEES